MRNNTINHLPEKETERKEGDRDTQRAKAGQKKKTAMYVGAYLF